MPFTSLEFIQYLNIVFIALIVIFGLIGFLRGTLKSLYYLGATIIVCIGGWFLMKPIINLMLSYDISSRGLIYEDIPITNVKQFITDFIIKLLPVHESIMTEETMTKQLVMSLIALVMRFVVLVILIVLAFTIFKWIFDIIWIFIKPRKKYIKGKKIVPKKGISSRLGGLGIGAVKGCFYSLLLFIPLAGIASISNEISETLDDEQQYQIVLIEDTMTVVESGNNKSQILSEDIANALDILGAYKQSVPGKVFGSITIGSKSIDDQFFDQLFSINVNNNKIKLRSEFQIVINILIKLKEKMPQDISLSKALVELAENDPELFEEIIEDLSTLKLINVVIPVGVEIALFLEDSNGERVYDKLPQELEIDYQDFQELDYKTDIKKLGYVFVDVLSLVSDNKIDYFNLDPEIVEEIFNNIGDLDIVEVIAPIAITYVFTIESLSNSLQQLNMSFEDLGLEDVEDWGQEIKQIGQIYQAFSELQISEFKPEGLKLVTEEAVNNFSEAIFDSIILKNAIPVMVNGLSNLYMPEDYREIIVFDKIVWDQNEFNAIINSAVLLIKTEVLSDDPEKLINFKTEDIDDLSKYLSNSKFITNNLNNIIKIVFDNLNVFPEDVEIITLDNEQWTSQELRSIFSSMQIIATENINNLLNLSDEKINNLSYNLANSKFITLNIDPILDSVFNNLDLGEGVTIGKFSNWDDPVASKKELIAVFNSAKIINAKGNNIDSFLSLSNNELDIFLDSEIISNTLINILQVYSEPGRELDFIIGTNNDNIDWLDRNHQIVNSNIIDNNLVIEPAPETTRYNIYVDGEKIISTNAIKYPINNIEGEIEVEAFTEGELRKLFKAINILSASIDNAFDINIITGLDDSEIQKILVSDILTLSIIDQIEKLSHDENSIVTIPEGPLTSLEQNVKLDSWKSKYKITSGGTYEYDSNGKLVLIKGELERVLKAMQILLDGENIEDIDINNLFDKNNQDIVLSSLVLEETIITQVEKKSQEEDPMIVIPNQIKDNRSLWKGKNGELRKLINSLNLLLGEDASLNNISFDINVFLISHDEILKSSVVLETAISNLESQQIINIPKGAGYGLNNPDDRSAWENKYLLDENDDYVYDEFNKVIIEEKGEFAYLLEGLDLLIEADPETGEKNFENINFNINSLFDEHNQDKFLKSYVISETAVNMVYDTVTNNSNLYIPSELYVNSLNDNSEYNRDLWFNIYKDDYVKKGELAHLLDAAAIVLNGEDFETIDFNLSIAFDDQKQETILKSTVFSESLVQMVYQEANNESSLLKIPSYIYVNELVDPSRDKWFNNFNGDIVDKGELAHLLEAAEIILDGGDFVDINFDLNKAYQNQDVVLKSVVFSETLVNMIFEEANNGVIKLPSSKYVNEITDFSRDKWFDDYSGTQTKKGELAHLLEASNILTNGSDFSNIDFEIDVLFNKENQNEILKSTVFSETIVEKILNKNEANEFIIIPDEDLDSNLFNDENGDRSAWFNEYNNDDIFENELANFLDGIALIVNESTFNDLNEISVDNILGLNLNVAHDENFDLVQSDFDLILESLILESTLAPLVDNIANNVLKDYLVMPDGEFNLYKHLIINEDNLYDKELYDLQSFLESLYLLNEAGINYNELELIDLVSGIDTDRIAKAMVVSRTFKRSIAKMFNKLIEPLPASFVQVDYDGSKLEAYNNLRDDLNTF